LKGSEHGNNEDAGYDSQETRDDPHTGKRDDN